MHPLSFASFKKAIPTWIKDKLFQKREIINELKKLIKVLMVKFCFQSII